MPETANNALAVVAASIIAASAFTAVTIIILWFAQSML